MPETSDDLTIWRYMDLTKFISMLASGSLWFAKAAHFVDDPWEGYGRAERYVPPTHDFLPKVVKRFENGVESMVSIADIGAKMSGLSADYIENARDHIYVNSWCLGASESMAMWEIYATRGAGIALRSSIESYRAAAKFTCVPDHYLFGEVVYHDQLDDVPELHPNFTETVPVGSGLWPKVLSQGLHKRSCFKHEREWRALLYQDKQEILGVHEPFDLEGLILEVRVGPRSTGLDNEVVKAVMERFGLKKPLVPSQLLTGPKPAPTAA